VHYANVVQGTSSEAVLVALLAARARTLRNRPKSDTLKLVAYSSDQAHSAFKKACMIAGINHVRMLPTRAEDDYALQVSNCGSCVLVYELDARMTLQVEAITPASVTVCSFERSCWWTNKVGQCHCHEACMCACVGE